MRRARLAAVRAKAPLLPRYFKLHETAARYTRRNAKPIEETIVGEGGLTTQRFAVFVHYDAKGAIADYVRVYLRALYEAGVRIWFMSNSPRLKPEDVASIKPLVEVIHRRNNFGYDFGAYKDGVLGILAREKPEQLILCNDSVYGPLHPLGTLLDKAAKRADACGLTESYELRYHLQSYFVVFNRRALEATEFLRFWQQAPYVDARGWLIHHGEVGLTQTLIGAGLDVKALYPSHAIAAHFEKRIEALRLQEQDAHRQRVPWSKLQMAQQQYSIAGAVEAAIPLNPTHFFWDVLIEDMQFPFVKRDLLQFNPARIASTTSWHKVIAGVSSYDTELIRRHLLPRLRNRSI